LGKARAPKVAPKGQTSVLLRGQTLGRPLRGTDLCFCGGFEPLGALFESPMETVCPST
jgi:hypothetical protein